MLFYKSSFSNLKQLNILHYEYFGYGLLNEHKASEKGCYKCADTAMKYLLNNLKLKQEEIILMGTSLGTGPTIYLAAKYREVAGIERFCDR